MIISAIKPRHRPQALFQLQMRWDFCAKNYRPDENTPFMDGHYLEDTYLYEFDAKLLKIESDERGQYCILDETIFYPQGGGQPSDTGRIEIDGKVIPITFAAFINAEVRHYGDFSSSEEGNNVHLTVDESRRQVNAKAHTSGHLVQCVIEEIDPALKAVKGYHFPDGSYVEFTGSSLMDAEQRINSANEKLSTIISTNVTNCTKLINKNELTELCPNLPYDVPEDKPTRVVSIGEYPAVPCGGTHLSAIGELDSVVISKIKRKKGNMKVS